MSLDEQFGNYLKRTIFWPPSWNFACHVTGPLFVICQVMRSFVLNRKVLVNLHNWSNGLELF